MRARYALIIAVLCVAALAYAQDQRAPWPSEYFNSKAAREHRRRLRLLHARPIVEPDALHRQRRRPRRDAVRAPRRPALRLRRARAVAAIRERVSRALPYRPGARSCRRTSSPACATSCRAVTSSSTSTSCTAPARACSRRRTSRWRGALFASIRIPDRYQNPFETPVRVRARARG